MRTVIIWMFILLSVPSLMAQKVFSQKELDAVLNPVLMEHAEEMLRFERMEINAGTLSEDDKPQVFTFTCTNVKDSSHKDFYDMWMYKRSYRFSSDKSGRKGCDSTDL